MVVKKTKRHMPSFWREDRNLSFFLAFLVLMTIFVPMVGFSRPGRIVIDLVFALMLLSGGLATIRSRILMYLVLSLIHILADGGEVVIYSPHITEVSYTHGKIIDEIGYHCRDYFMKQWDKFKNYPGGVLALSLIHISIWYSAAGIGIRYDTLRFQSSLLRATNRSLAQQNVHFRR